MKNNKNNMMKTMKNIPKKKQRASQKVMRSHHQLHPTKLARAYQHKDQERGELE